MREILRFGCDPDYLSSCLGIKPDSEGEAREQFDELSIRAVPSEKPAKQLKKIQLKKIRETVEEET